MCLKPKLKNENGIYNLFINNKEIQTPENALFNFKDKIFQWHEQLPPTSN